jgi:hypothetical protein
VESLSIEEPVELRPPQYALVTFGSLETVLLILDGKEKVKFVTGGKHLWARKYVPKQQQKAKTRLGCDCIICNSSGLFAEIGLSILAHH